MTLVLFSVKSADALNSTEGHLMPDSLQFEAKIQRQLQLEDEGIQEGIRQYHKAVLRKTNSHRGSETKPAIRIMEMCMPPLYEAIENFKKGGKQQKVGRKLYSRAFLKDVDSMELAYLTLRHVLDTITTPQPLQRAAVQLGKLIEHHKDYLRLKKEHPNILHFLERYFVQQKSGVIYRRYVLSHKRLELEMETENWDERTCAMVGLKLLELCVTATGLVHKVYHTMPGQR